MRKGKCKNLLTVAAAVVAVAAAVAVAVDVFVVVVAVAAVVAFVAERPRFDSVETLPRCRGFASRPSAASPSTTTSPTTSPSRWR